jgi:hypothetical protein
MNALGSDFGGFEFGLEYERIVANDIIGHGDLALAVDARWDMPMSRVDFVEGYGMTFIPMVIARYYPLDKESFKDNLGGMFLAIFFKGIFIEAGIGTLFGVNTEGYKFLSSLAISPGFGLKFWGSGRSAVRQAFILAVSADYFMGDVSGGLYPRLYFNYDFCF